MRRISYIITSLIMVFSMATITAFAKPDWPIDTGIQSEAGIVMDMDSGAVLFAQNIHEQKIPASITKLMTALLVAENTTMDQMVTFSETATTNLEAGAVGLNVTAGDVIGYMGHTGYSTTENVNNIEVTHLHWGLELVFDEEQKESDNEIWIDVYPLTCFLAKHTQEVQKVEGTREWIRTTKIREF